MAQRKKNQPSQRRQSPVTMAITYPNAAGIDIGCGSHFVAVQADRDDQPVREFPSFTSDLNAIADVVISLTRKH